MRIVINSAHQRFGGAIQVVLSFVNECRYFPEHEYHVWVGPGLKKSLLPDQFGENFKFYYFDFGPINFWKTFQINRKLKEVENEIKPDVIIATSGPTYFNSSAPQIIGYNLPNYIYTDSPFIKNLKPYPRLRWWFKKSLHKYYFRRDGAAFLAQTNDVNQRAQKYLSSVNVFTVTNTYSNFYKKVRDYNPKLPPKAPGKVRLLTISAYYAHKDLEIIPKVQQELIARGFENLEFVLTVDHADFESRIADETPGIINMGPVKPEECPSLYRECDIMFLPTLAECFSASYPEAMIMEKPIITTDLGFAKSICGEAALYYTPTDPVSAADKIEYLLNKLEIGKQLIEQGKKQLNNFDSAETRAKKYLNICENFRIK